MIDYHIYKKLLGSHHIEKQVLQLIEECERELSDEFNHMDTIAAVNQIKVLNAFRDNELSDRHFAWNTGYGYGDIGREITEAIFSQIFGTEKALVRTNIVNGTHAISLCLQGLLTRGDELIYATGDPYDTLHTVIGLREEGMGSLKEMGVEYKSIPLLDMKKIDISAILKAITVKTKIVAFQRSKGYSRRASLTLEELAHAIAMIKEKYPDIIIFVDNCYGEFVEELEPTNVGADIIAGSLIKNPGGSLALSGGYIAGKEALIKRISYRLTCPGIGAECGLTFGQVRSILHGLFIAPTIVASAYKTAILMGSAYKKLGFDVFPSTVKKRGDIIQGISFHNEDMLKCFVQSIQASAPVDSFVKPEPWPMPGYDNDIIMASGSFVTGSSIEASADGPIKPPFNAYYQGGITFEHGRYVVCSSIQSLLDKGFVTL